MASKNNLQDEALKNAQNAVYQSENTQAAKAKADSYENNPYAVFQTSQKTNDAYNYWQQTQANKPEDYKSNYGDTISNLLDQIVNRKDFSYDFNADPLYQQYKDQYTTAGKQAMKDTVAQVSNQTGGYGNSYAETAGSQAYQGYLQRLNDVIPQLYNQALNKYKMDTDALNNKFNVVGSQEDREYGQWSNNYGLWQNDLNYGMNAYNNLWNQDMSEYNYNNSNWLADRNFNYGKYRDSVSDDYNAYNNAYQAALNAQKYDYQTGRDQIADNQWQQSYDFNRDKWAQEFAYQQQRDAVADKQWAANYALQQAKLNSSTSGKNGSNGSNEDTYSKQDQNIMKTGEYKDAYNYAYQIVNHTYGERGEVTTIAWLANRVSDGDITERAMDLILDQLGIDTEKFSPEEIRQFALENGFRI